MNLLVQDLARCMPSCPSDRVVEFQPFLESAMTEKQIEPTYRAAAFLAQIGHESIDMRFTREINAEHARYAPYFGRGLIQITWRDNYLQCGYGLLLDLVNHPEYLETPENACRSAAWFWATHGLNAWADKLERDGRQAFDEISRRIQGRAAPQNSLDQRWARYLRCLTVMTTPTVVT